jgi:site-specific recombinase XerD
MNYKYSKLPGVAREFLSESTILKREMVVSAFHKWMDRWKLTFATLRPLHIYSFLHSPHDIKIADSTRHQYRSVLVRYLKWLHDRDLLHFDPENLRGVRGGGLHRRPMPEPAASFIRNLEPNHKKNSLNGYRTALRRFHRFLDSHSFILEKLERRHMSMWLLHLKDAGLVPKNVNHHIIFVRLYLRWLYENDAINAFPDDLIRVSDMVKEPKYLPRPLSPSADEELQRRLKDAGDLYSLGLLLMRKTGIRNGELRSLENNCIRRDHRGNVFLKVPLGKLDNERLVPIDKNTEELIERIRSQGETPAEMRFLLETKKRTQTRYPSYIAALKKASDGLDTNGKMCTHRLRHTYATALLNAGMSLVGLMKLLGHTDHRMTLRYADVTQETVAKEYFKALERLECRYSEVLNNKKAYEETEPNPYKMLDDVVHRLATMAANDDDLKSIARAITKRIKRIQRHLKPFCLYSNSPK